MNKDNSWLGYTRADRKPSQTAEMRRLGQVWVWLAGAPIPHWEIRGTGFRMEPGYYDVPFVSDHVGSED